MDGAVAGVRRAGGLDGADGVCVVRVLAGAVGRGARRIARRILLRRAVYRTSRSSTSRHRLCKTDGNVTRAWYGTPTVFPGVS